MHCIEELEEHLTYDQYTGALTVKKKFGNKAVGALLGYKQNMSGKLYWMMRFKGQPYLVHRVAYALMKGRWATPLNDHEDGDGLNNKWTNIREASHGANNKNSKLPSHNTSGIIGVCRTHNKERWKAGIQTEGKTIHLGTFDTMEEAAAARKQAELKYDFHPNHGRS